jgi:hypothetical protein
LESSNCTVKIVFGKVQCDGSSGGQDERQFDQESELANVSSSDDISLREEDVFVRVHGKNIQDSKIEEGIDVVDFGAVQVNVIGVIVSISDDLSLSQGPRNSRKVNVTVDGDGSGRRHGSKSSNDPVVAVLDSTADLAGSS